MQVAVALGPSVYMWSASSGTITQLMSTASEDDYITSLAWAADGKHISVGTYSSQVRFASVFLHDGSDVTSHKSISDYSSRWRVETKPHLTALISCDGQYANLACKAFEPAAVASRALDLPWTM